MTPTLYAFAALVAIIYAVSLAYLARTSAWWQAQRTRLPVRRLAGLLLGGPFLLAATACGSSSYIGDGGACAMPGDGCDSERCCDGTVCAVSESGERYCIADGTGGAAPITCPSSVADRGYPMCTMQPTDVDATFGTEAGCPVGQWRGAEPCLYQEAGGTMQAYALCIDHAKLGFTCDPCAPMVSCGVGATCSDGVCVAD